MIKEPFWSSKNGNSSGSHKIFSEQGVEAILCAYLLRERPRVQDKLLMLYL